MSEKRKFFIKISLSIFLLFAASAILQAKLGLSIQNMEELVASYGKIAPIIYGIMLFLGLTIPFNPIPDYALVIAASLLLTPTQAILATFCAHAVAIIVNYFIGKKIGFKIIDVIAKNSEMEILSQVSRKITPTQVFLLRFVLPITAIGVDLVSYAAGMAKMNFPRYFLASVVPWTIYNILFFTLTGYAKTQSNFYVLAIAAIFVGLSVLVVKKVNDDAKS